MNNYIRKLVFLTLFFCTFSAFAAGHSDTVYPIPLSDYESLEASASLFDILKSRVVQDPFNLVALIIFSCAILHTFCYRYFSDIAHKIEHHHKVKIKADPSYADGTKEKPVNFWGTVFHYLGEIEVVFAIWLIPLFIALICMNGLDSLIAYLDNMSFTEKKFIEPVFVVVVMAIAATRPVIQFAENLIRLFASMGKSTPAAWWVSILILGPLLGSFITEPVAITISALLLYKKVFSFSPSLTLKYATLAILLVCISTGGTLTHFAAPPVLMVANKWGWDMSFMFINFGLKAIVGILIIVALGYALFRKEFKKLAAKKISNNEFHKEEAKVKPLVMLGNLFFLAYSVLVLHHIVLLIIGFLFFIAYTQATSHYQGRISLKTPILVGLFLTGLVIHGGLQAWWIEPVLTRFGSAELFVGSIILTAFNDNAAITYLASLVPDFSDTMKYFVVAGAVTGGGLTVIANAPNPAGIAILGKSFKGGISPIKLLLYALIPTIIMALCFFLA